MTPFLPDTHSEPHGKVLHLTLQHFFCGRAAISWRMESFSSSIVRGLFVYTLDYRSGSSKCFNPLEYSVSIWNCTSTLNIELSTEKTLDSNYGITVSKKLLDGKHTMLYVPMRHGYWNCIVWSVRRLTPNIINPHPCRVLAIWKTCVSSAPPCTYFMIRTTHVEFQTSAQLYTRKLNFWLWNKTAYMVMKR